MINNSRIRSLRAKFSGDHVVTITVTDHNQVFVFDIVYDAIENIVPSTEPTTEAETEGEVN